MRWSGDNWNWPWIFILQTKLQWASERVTVVKKTNQNLPVIIEFKLINGSDNCMYVRTIGLKIQKGY